MARVRAKKRLHGVFGAAAPFEDASGHKGWMENLSRSRPHQVTRTRISLPQWAPEMPDLTAAVLSDFHFGSHAGDMERFAALVEEINGWNSDAVFLLGDYMNTALIGKGRVPPEAIAEVLGGLTAPLGVWSVLGNHDWEYGGFFVRRALEAVDIGVLENEARLLDHQGQALSLVGMADEGTRRPCWVRGLRDVSHDSPAIVLAHDPASFKHMPARGGVMLSGHTHGGQVRLPLVGALGNSSKAPLKWSQGHTVQEDKQLFVTRGLGTSILPLRVNCPPEICQIVLGA